MAFMPCRHILEGVVVMQETIHELHTKKLDRIDFENAYDKVKWSFMRQTLWMNIFAPSTLKFIMTLVIIFKRGKV